MNERSLENALRELATTASECEVWLWGRVCGGDRWGACGKVETGQEGPDDLGLRDHGDQLAPSRASGTLQDVDLEHPAHQIRPAEVPFSQRRQLLPERSDARSCGWRGRRAVRTISNDTGTPLGPGRQDAVVAQTVRPRPSYEHGELLYELELG